MVDVNTYSLTWDAQHLSSGVYMIKAESNGQVATQKMKNTIAEHNCYIRMQKRNCKVQVKQNIRAKHTAAHKYKTQSAKKQLQHSIAKQQANKTQGKNQQPPRGKTRCSLLVFFSIF